MLSNCGAGEDAWESLDSKEIKPINPKGNQPWIFIGRTGGEALILWLPDMKSRLIGKDSWFWERLRAEGQGDDRGWDGWMASLTRWTWVWLNSERQPQTGKLGVQQAMGLQRVRHVLTDERFFHYRYSNIESHLLSAGCLEDKWGMLWSLFWMLGAWAETHSHMYTHSASIVLTMLRRYIYHVFFFFS